jgi:hypothetical protein
MSEDRLIRNRHQTADDLIDRSPYDPPDGARSILVTTTVAVTYPTAAGVFYACYRTDVTGSETEGSTPTFSQQNQIFYVLNLGTAVPPQGTPRLAENEGGIWVMRYDG